MNLYFKRCIFTKMNGMMNPEKISSIALGLEATEEQPHFEKRSFRHRKKIFATLDEKNKHLVVKLTEVDQSVFSTAFPGMIYPVPNKWGKQGWTRADYEQLSEETLTDLLSLAHRTVGAK